MTASQRAWTAEATRKHVETCLELGIYAVYQPIVDLASGRAVAVEALARPPAQSAFDSPGPLFVAAKRVGLHAELDQACRKAALDGAARLPAGTGLFVNVEPDVLAATRVADLPALFDLPIPPGIHALLEITERALSDRTPELMTAIAVARELGRSVAIDDVGTNPDALALLSFIRPDVVRLDGSLVQAAPGRKAAHVAAIVNAYTERTGAQVLAECIETEEHLEHAIALGATLGQGWMFGRPGPLPEITEVTAPISRIPSARVGLPLSTPFRLLVDAGVSTHVASRATVRLIAQRLGMDAVAASGRPVILSALPRNTLLPDHAHDRYIELAKRTTFIAALGVGVPAEVVPGMRGFAIDGDDPLADHHAFITCGDRAGAALAMRPMGDDQFEYVVTHRPELVEAAAECLMQRVVASTRGSLVS